MDNRRFLYLALLSLCAAKGGFAQVKQRWKNPPFGGSAFAQTLKQYAQEEQSVGTIRSEVNSSADVKDRRSIPDLRERKQRELGASAEAASISSKYSAFKRGKPETYTYDLESGISSFVAGIQLLRERTNPNCREWKNEACTVCGIDSTIEISVKNKTKTPVLLCRDMKPGPARVLMLTHAEPAIPGVWEVEFGLGYQTSAKHECPHQFIASNNPPLKTAYEVGPITIEGEIPLDGMIQALACVGLSSARVGEEGKETGASLRVFKLRVVSE